MKKVIIGILAILFLVTIGIAETGSDVNATAGEVDPRITDLTVELDEYDPGNTVNLNVTVEEDEGVDQISEVYVEIWLPGIGEQGEENWDSYVLENGTWDEATESTEDDITMLYEWSFDLSQHAHYTNETTSEYKINATVIDIHGNNGTMQIDGFNVTKMTGITLSTAELTVTGKAGEEDNLFNEQPNVTHTGNVDQNIEISGTDLTSNGNIIEVENIKYWNANQVGEAQELSEVSNTFEEISPMERGIYDSPTQETMYYWLTYPLGTPAGDYTGTITLETSIA